MNKVLFVKRLGGTVVLCSAVLVAFLGDWEGKNVTRVYADKLAGGIPTVCKGLTRHVTKEPIIVGEDWPLEKCEREEQKALEKVQLDLIKCFRLLPPQGVFDMASSHAWNNGAGNTCQSLAMEAWNVGEWELGCRRLSRSDEGKHVWSYVRTGRILPNGAPEKKFVQGLANRRADETKTCLESLE